MNVLVLCDDYWHPAKTVRAGLAPLQSQGFDFDFIEDAHDFSSGQLDAYPVVMLVKSNNVSAKDQAGWMSDEIQQAFARYVEHGGGLLAVHSGTAGYAETPVLKALLGGVFSHHPDQCDVTASPAEGHPLAEGVEPFTLKDEHYHMAMEPGPAEVFLTTTSQHGAQPGGWTKAAGQGRVCVLTPGHNLEVWLSPSFQRLLKNALNWCARAS